MVIANDFQGIKGQTVPFMSDKYIETIAKSYIELYENITGETFVKADLQEHLH